MRTCDVCGKEQEPDDQWLSFEHEMSLFPDLNLCSKKCFKMWLFQDDPYMR